MADMSPKIRFMDEEKVKNINPETQKLWRRYEVDMKIRNLSQGTIDGYKNDLSHLFIYIYDNYNNVPITELTEEEITEFIYYCQSQGNNTRRIKRRLSSISAFFKFLRKKKIIVENPMEFIDRPKKDVDVLKKIFLTKAQVDDMRAKLEEAYNNAGTVGSKHLALSHWCYAIISLSTMARVNAISSIRWEQIDMDTRTVCDVLEKEGKIVDLYFSEECKNLLNTLIEYRKANDIDDDGYLFVARDVDGYHRANTGTLSQWSKRIGQYIGVPELHPHTFRKTGSNLLKEAGMPLEDIASLLNHESTETTNKFYINKKNTKAAALKDTFDI